VLTIEDGQQHCVAFDTRDREWATKGFSAERDAMNYATALLADLVSRGWDVTRWARAASQGE
jgi:hypothetical protein